MLLNYETEITILYNGGGRNAHFETRKSGWNDKQNKIDKLKIKQVYVGHKFND